MTIGERIKHEMKSRGISQNKLAKAAQISQSGLSSIINGASSPKENTLQAIASALGMTASDLLGNDSGAKKEPATAGGSEEIVVKKYRKLTADQQKQADMYLDFLIASQDKKET
jgi:transcriptional regulator with XRE-family HTH domain